MPKCSMGASDPRVKTHPFVSECIVALYSNSALSAQNGTILTLKYAPSKSL